MTEQIKSKFTVGGGKYNFRVDVIEYEDRFELYPSWNQNQVEYTYPKEEAIRQANAMIRKKITELDDDFFLGI